MLIRTQRGVTLIELVIGLAIVAMVMAMGIPEFSQWLQNTQNRTAAESVLNGLQLARAEAVKRNTPVRFELTDLNGKVAWKVSCVTTAVCATIQEHALAEGNGTARIGISKTEIPLTLTATHFSTALPVASDLEAGTGVSFDALGRVPAANVGDDVFRFDIVTDVPDGSKIRVGKRYVLTVARGGQIRMCDPNLAVTKSPQGCS